ncbi:MAG: triose-phosphate isomerase [Gammaproteobacteria bacterium]|jgi:triosephosphate isomerase|nr:triose-phosphate isomerase [Gammaproteobacteria bacterium]MDP7296767.1 triose-phosphate isomerase [Gammaproteobacteria bacterium]MDP7418586.1 triose-phosphate isomerase [Gammaproteobacteria bacterium]MDP7661174.1 triose-phosphate isomerase [Gammaproteobacteria bacterium]HJP38779.1 triose-phosphate isomerase [Gammaproteobacteria bacterium]
MRTKLVAGNWKLNGSRDANHRLVAGILAHADEAAAAEILLCPPYVYLSQVSELIAGSAVRLGGQNVAVAASGAYTGEISAAMLQDAGCSHVIIGHSERRSMFGDTDEVVAAKFRAAHQQGLTPILCIGESQQERESGVTMEIIDRQVGAVLDAAGIEPFADSIVAYEPVWAIGTGLTANPEQAQEVHAHVRSIFAARDANIAADLRILYGGSVKGANALQLFTMEDIDGGLIGGASLDSDEFLAICRAAAGTKLDD